MSTAKVRKIGKIVGMDQPNPSKPRTNSEPTVKPIVRLIDQIGGISAIIEKVCHALSDVGQHDQIERYMQEALSGNHHNLLQVTLDFVEVE